MSLEQRHKLADTMSRVVSNIDIEDVTKMAIFILANGATKELVLKEISTFLYREMQLQISGS